MKLRGGHTGFEWALNPIISVLIRRGKEAQGHRYTGRIPRGDRGRDCTVASTNKGI